MRLDNLDPLNLKGQFRPMYFANAGGAAAASTAPITDPPAGDPPAGDPPAGDPPPAAVPVAWHDNFSDDIKAHPSLQKFKGPEDLAKSYINLETKISSKGVLVPGENAGQEEVDKFYTDLGRPETFDRYEITLDEGTDSRLGLDDARMGLIKGMMFKHGLSQKQASGLAKDFVADQASNLARFDEMAETENNETITALRQKWGNTYDSKVTAVQGLIEKFGSPELKTFLEEKGGGRNAAFLHLMANISSVISEDVMGPAGGGGSIKAPHEAKIEIAKIKGDSNHPWHHPEHNDHKEAQGYMTSLYKMAFPEGTDA